MQDAGFKLLGPWEVRIGRNPGEHELALLREALRLWRGRPFGDAGPAPLHELFRLYATALSER
jgi:hypothetical protein